jgi:hypothetical protein
MVEALLQSVRSVEAAEEDLEQGAKLLLVVLAMQWRLYK